MAYDNVRLPTAIERGSQGGLGFYTNIVAASAGSEDRNQNWEDEKGEWDISYGVQRRGQLDDVRNHHFGRRGQAHSFPFRDWFDYQSGPANDLSPTFQLNATVATTTFQLVKTYADSVRVFQRRIFKPDPATLIVYLDAVSKAYTIDAYGIVTLTAPVVGTPVVTALFQFDVPVRYVSDRLDLNLVYVNTASMPSIKIQGVFPPAY